MLTIVTAPSPVLSQKAKPVPKVDRGILRLVVQMKEALDSASDPIGVGLAAPQIGKSLRLFIARPSLKSRVLIFINPKIIKKSSVKKVGKEKKHTKLEGCLSLPSIWGEVKRYNEIEAEFLDETGKLHRKKFKGFMAIILQHEVDHLDGILFPKRVLEQKGTLYKSEKDKKGEDVFDEIKI